MSNNLMAATSSIPQVLVSQFVANSETTQYTASSAGGGSAVKIAKATLCNTSGSAVNISASVVKSGGTAGSSNRVVSAFSLAAGDTLILEEMGGLMLGPGDFISAVAGSSSAVVFMLSGVVFS